jgi:hypothetical protein
MQNIGLIFLVFAFVFGCISTRWWTMGVWNTMGLAITFWIASELIGGVARSGLRITMIRKLALALALSLAASAASAATVTLTWTNPTTRTDGSVITGALTTSIYDIVTPPAGPPLASALVGTGTSPFTTPVLASGGHAFTVINCEAGGGCSAPSNAVLQTVAPATPNAVTDLSGVTNP